MERRKKQGVWELPEIVEEEMVEGREYTEKYANEYL